VLLSHRPPAAVLCTAQHYCRPATHATTHKRHHSLHAACPAQRALILAIKRHASAPPCACATPTWAHWNTLRPPAELLVTIRLMPAASSIIISVRSFYLQASPATCLHTARALGGGCLLPTCASLLLRRSNGPPSSHPTRHAQLSRTLAALLTHLAFAMPHVSLTLVWSVSSNSRPGLLQQAG
jgi:hypothetical protein